MAFLSRAGASREGKFVPDRIDKSLLILGLLLYLAGQIWINITGSMTKDQIAIDGIHWLLLIGAALMIPFAARLPRNGVGLLAGPLLLVGIVLIIGMNVLDFVLWSFPASPLRDQVVNELIATPAVWSPFMVFSGWVFTPALALASFTYWRSSRVGPLLAVAGMISIGAFPIWSNPYGYAMIVAGFTFCFRAASQGPSTRNS